MQTLREAIESLVQSLISSDLGSTVLVTVGTLGAFIGVLFWHACRELSLEHAVLRQRPLRSRTVFVTAWEAICCAFVVVGLVAVSYPINALGHITPPPGSIESLLLPLAIYLMFGSGIVDMFLIV